MQTQKFLLGVAGGLIAGYAAVRTIEAARVLRGRIATRPADAAAYGATRRALALAGIARSMAGSAALAYGPLGELMEESVSHLPQWLRPPIFALEGFLLDTLVDAPADLVEGFGLERAYELSEQSLGSWINDKVKQEAIGAAVTALLTAIFAQAIRRWPRTWPYIASAGVFPLLLLANIVIPIYIMPLFNEYRPIEGDLERRLRALATRYGVGDADILRMDMSKQTKKANAFVTGIGNTHRIVVGDTLINNFPPEEIEFVVAHELGHYVSRDSWRLILIGQIAATLMLFAAYAALGERGRKHPESPRTLAQIQWWSVLFSQAIRPAISAFSRSREWAADRFALEATHAPITGAAAFRRLRDQNLAEDEQPGWYEFIFSSHPSLKARIAALSSVAL